MNGVKTTFRYKGEEPAWVELWTDGIHAALGAVEDAMDGERELKQVVIDLDQPHPFRRQDVPT